MSINIDEAMARLTKAYLKECDKIGLSRSRAQRKDDLDSALSCFYIRACKLGKEMRNPQAIAVYAVRDVLFRENLKSDRERWVAEVEEAEVSADEDDINEIVEEQFPEAVQAVYFLTAKRFLRRTKGELDLCRACKKYTCADNFFLKRKTKRKPLTAFRGSVIIYAEVQRWTIQ